MNNKRNKVPRRPKPAAQGRKQTADMAKTAQRRKHINVPYYFVLLLSLWAFCGWVYGGVFYMSEQCSYFAWDATLMHFLLQQNLGFLKAAGRFLLLFYRYPVLGGLLLSSMLTLVVWLLCRIIPIPARFRGLTALIPFGFLAYFVGLNYSINYHRETSWLFSLPLAALVILAVVYLIKRWLAPHSSAGKCGDKWYSSLVPVVLLAAFTTFCALRRSDLITTCSLQRMVESRDWEEMTDKALACRQPSRSVAAYFAIALAETGQLQSRLFELPFQYPHYKVREMDGQKSDGVAIYSLDADFYAGIPNSSYHESMEIMVKNGPQLFLLKKLARAAAVNGEYRLCWKYLTIIDRNPFESGFTKRYREFLHHPRTIASDPEFRHVYAKLPVEDTFEQRYRKPLFMGYSTTLYAGRSFEALDASLMSLLYSKDQRGFLDRVRILSNTQLAPYYQQAVISYTLRDPNILSQFPTIEKNMSLTRFQTFVREAQMYLSDMPRGEKELKAEWLNYYPYYLYFENLLTSTSTHSNEKEKAGVN